MSAAVAALPTMMRVDGRTVNVPGARLSSLGTGSSSSSDETGTNASGTDRPAAPCSIRCGAAPSAARSQPATATVSNTTTARRLKPGIPLPHGPVQRRLGVHLPEERALHRLPEDLVQLARVGHHHGEVSSELQLVCGDRPCLHLWGGALLPEERVGGGLLRRRKEHN